MLEVNKKEMRAWCALSEEEKDYFKHPDAEIFFLNSSGKFDDGEDKNIPLYSNCVYSCTIPDITVEELNRRYAGKEYRRTTWEDKEFYQIERFITTDTIIDGEGGGIFYYDKLHEYEFRDPLKKLTEDYEFKNEWTNYAFVDRQGFLWESECEPLCKDGYAIGKGEMVGRGYGPSQAIIKRNHGIEPVDFVGYWVKEWNNDNAYLINGFNDSCVALGTWIDITSCNFMSSIFSKDPKLPFDQWLTYDEVCREI